LRISSVEGHNFRNLVAGSLELGPGLNWFVGPNGQGKTNFLEMVYFALTGKSFRTSRLGDLISGSEKDARVTAVVVKNGANSQFGVLVEGGKCRRLLGGKNCTALDFFKTAAVISFTERAKNLVIGHPDDRRRFIDRMVATLEPEHIISLGQYRKIRNQLKKILIGSRDLGVYQSFKTTLVPVAEKIVRRRMLFLDSVRDRTREIFREIFLGEGALHFEYKLKNVKDLNQYSQRLLQLSSNEILHGKSLVGPHLDDLDIVVEKNNARHYASAGQVRAIVLSLKLAVRESYKNLRGHLPILLLDDIDAEIDSQRLKSLIGYLKTQGQSLISTSKYAMIGKLGQGDIYMVSAGCISPKDCVDDS